MYFVGWCGIAANRVWHLSIWYQYLIVNLLKKCLPKPFSLYFRQEGLVCLYVGRRVIHRNSRNGGMAERQNGGNGGTAERMAEWQNGRNGYICTIHGRHTHTNNDTDDDTDDDTLIYYSIDFAGSRRVLNHRFYLKIRPMSYFHDGNLYDCAEELCHPSPKQGCFWSFFTPPGRTQRRIYDLFFVRVFLICTAVTAKSVTSYHRRRSPTQPSGMSRR